MVILTHKTNIENLENFNHEKINSASHKLRYWLYLRYFYKVVKIDMELVLN